MTKIQFVDTTLRDGHTSLWAMGMKTDWILPIAKSMDSVGFDAIEIGSTPSVKKMVRELSEDPWLRIKLSRDRINQTPLRVIRGRSLAGFQMSPRCLEELWYERLAANGAKQVRMTDASNTASVWQDHSQMALKNGLDMIVNLTFTLSPKHTDEYYAIKAKEASNLDIYRICLKDPGGLLTPDRTRTLVPAILKNIGNKLLEFHTHCNTGLGPLSCLEAIKQGIRCINAAVPPLANASSNPSVLNVAMNARTLGYTTELNEEILNKVSDHFMKIAIRENLPIGLPLAYEESHYLHQVPGGMISNLRHQLKLSGIENKIDIVLDEIGKVREEFGYPIMVTPYAQFVGSQAVFNIISGERYKIIPDEVILYALGFWGEEESNSINLNLKDRILNSNRAKELSNWELKEPSLLDIRKKYGGSQVSDDDLILRYLAGTESVLEMQKNNSISAFNLNKNELIPRLINELSKNKEINYFQVNFGNDKFKLAVKK